MKSTTSAERTFVRLAGAMVRRSHLWMSSTAAVFFILTAIAWLSASRAGLTSGAVAVNVFFDRSPTPTTRAQLDVQIRCLKDVYSRTSFAIRDAGTIEIGKDSAVLGQGVNIVATSEAGFGYGHVANVRGQSFIFIDPANAPPDMLAHEFAHVELGHASIKHLPPPFGDVENAILDLAVEFRLLLVRMRHR